MCQKMGGGGVARAYACYLLRLVRKPAAAAAAAAAAAVSTVALEGTASRSSPAAAAGASQSILASSTKKPPAQRTYVGITVDVPRRLRQHNGEIVGGAISTRLVRGSTG